MLPGTTYLRLDRGNLDGSAFFLCLREAAKKEVRHTFGNLKNPKRYILGMGYKLDEYEQQECVTPLTHLNKRTENKEDGNTKREKRGLEPTNLESYYWCKQYITQALNNPLTH